MKIGIVGYGSIGKRHYANAEMLGHEARYFDPALEGGWWFEEKLYDWSDAVVVATPSGCHAAGMRAAAKRGRHMLVEKPIALSDRGIQELLDLAEKNKAIVMVGNNLRFHPCVQQAKQWIDAGEIGKPIWAHFTCASQSVKPLYLSDGVILNTGAHEVDMALHLLGPAKVVYVDAVHAQGADVIADFLLLHENGCRSSFHLDFVTPNDLRGFCVAGIDGNVGGDLLRRNVYASGSNDFQQYIGSYDDDYVAEMRAFIDRIEGKDVPGATGADGLATLKVLLDVRKKAGL